MEKSPEDNLFEIHFYESIHKKNPEDFRVIELLGHLYTANGEINKGLEMDLKAIALKPKNALARYNLACSYALSGALENALKTLEKAIDLGYNDLDWLMKDTDLDPLRELHAFKKLIEKMKSLLS